MVKSVGKRFLPFLLTIMMVLSLMPVVYAADTVEGLSDPSIVLTYTGEASWTASGTTITGTVTGEGGTCSKDHNGTLTIKNNKPTAATLSFSYTPTLNDGTVTVAGTNVTAAGTFSREIAAGGTITISIKSAKAAKTTKISITNVKLFADVTVTTTFLPSAGGGTYTVDGEAVTASIQKTQSSTQPISLVATPQSGYRFFGWQSSPSGAIVSKEATWSNGFDVAQTIQPIFVKSGAAVFQVGKQYFDDLNAAKTVAVNGSDKKIVLAENGTLAAGNYQIPNGVTLLIPYEAGYNIVKDSPDVLYNTYAKPSAFRLLTMAKNAKITIESGGAISVAGQLSSKGQLGGYNGTPTGPDGRIKMNAGSSITVKNGGNLYVWGYIYGSGAVTAEAGSTVHEAFQIKDWRGGTATSSVVSYAFIINQYYVQNIEVPLTLYAGATEKLYSAANTSTPAAAYPIGATFVGADGLFNITSGYIVKDYIESTDRLQVDAYGDVKVSPMTLKDTPAGDISTDDYVLPITSNITINIHDNKTATVMQDIEMLPGTEINIDEGSTLNISSGKSVYVYDNDNWGNFTGNARLYVIGYSVANGTTAKRTADSLTDSRINVNGTLNVSGKLYTSKDGANITSSAGTGKVIFAAASGGDATIYEMADNSTKTAVSFNPARLHNGVNTSQYAGTDQEYTQTAGAASGDQFVYSAKADKWLKNPVTVTWKNFDGAELGQDLIPKGDTPVYDGDIPTKANDSTNYYVFTGWDKTPAPASGDVTYTAQFAPKALKFNIEVYYNVDGTQGEQAVYQKTYDYTQSVRLGAEKEYKDGEDVYTFSHWDVDGVHYPALKITVRPGSADHTVVAQAVYVKNAADAEYQGDALLKVISVEAETIGHQTTKETNKLVFTLSQSVPEGEADAVGFVVSQTNQNPIIDGEGVMIAKSNLKTATSTFTTRVDVTGQIDQPIYVRAYLTYKNNGTSVTIYSDEPAVVYTFPTV